MAQEQLTDPAALARQLSLFEAMIEAVPVGIAVTDANGKILEGNSCLEAMVRHPIYHSEHADAYGEWVSFHPDGRRVESAEYPLARVIKENIDRCELTVQYQRGDKSLFWMRIIGSSIRDKEGALIGACVACVDVDDEHRLQESQRVLIAELNHRVKNAFSVTNAIVGRSLRKGEVSKELREDIDRRLNAYAAAHASLVGEDVRSASLRDVAEEVLNRIDVERFDIEGGDIEIDRRTALPFSMAFYELASNASKYGSLRSDHGRVRLSWSIRQRADENFLLIEWQEEGGPAAHEPETEGFGTFVTGRALMAETGGEVERHYGEDGFRWTLTMPITREQAQITDREITRIFIVEDEVFVAFEMTEILQEVGFEVVGPALNAEDAQQLARNATIDAAFLDVNLGGGRTSEPVARILRERGVPFVFVTAYTPDQITFRTTNDQVLEKPVTSSRMYETLRKVLPNLELPDAT